MGTARWIPSDLIRSHQIPPDPTSSHPFPPGPTGSHRIPLGSTCRETVASRMACGSARWREAAAVPRRPATDETEMHAKTARAFATSSARRWWGRKWRGSSRGHCVGIARGSCGDQVGMMRGSGSGDGGRCDSRSQLTDSRSQLTDSRSQLTDSRSQLTDSRSQLTDSRS